MPELDCFLGYRVGYGTLHTEFYVWKIPRRPACERAVVLKWFYSLRRRKTFVGGKYALPSALLVPFATL